MVPILSGANGGLVCTAVLCAAAGIAAIARRSEKKQTTRRRVRSIIGLPTRIIVISTLRPAPRASTSPSRDNEWLPHAEKRRPVKDWRRRGAQSHFRK